MIPLTHQVLRSLVLGPRGSPEDVPDAQGFIAALAQGDDSPTTPDPVPGAEASLVGGMLGSAPPKLITQPIPPERTVSAEPGLTAAKASPAQPAPLPATEANPSELTTAPTGTPTMPIDTALPMVLTAKNQPQPAAFAAAETPVVSGSAPDQLLAQDKSPHLLTASKKPREVIPAAATSRRMSDPASIPPAPEPVPEPEPVQNANSVTRESTAAQIIAPPQRSDQPTAKSAATNHPTQTQSIQPLPEQIPADRSQAAPPPPTPETPKTSLSPAESAWQTRLQRADPLGAQPKPTSPAVSIMGDAARAPADSPISTAASVTPTFEHIGFTAFLPSNPLAAVALPSQGTDSQNRPAAKAATSPDLQPVAPTSARQASDTTPESTPDATATPNPPAALPDQVTLQPAPDQISQQTNPISPQPIPPQQTGQPQTLAPTLATTVPTQLLPHTAAATTGGVDVLLQPEELGHVKFQIQQHGETVRILLSAERPETLDLLRRHSDQLLQEFRQSGFSQASLDFGQWGQQQRSPAPPPELAALFDADFVEAPPVPRQSPMPTAAGSGQGLNLRL